MASSSTSSVPKRFKFDVFLSFRGEDTRKNFIDHLYHALQERNIHTYKDDERINKGKRISDELMGSIEDSKFFIIVFSKTYASSSWCLSELLKIMECNKTTEHTVYPIFYDVEPSEVRNQIGAVGEAFARHEKEEAAGKWRKALKEAADLAGWELKNTADGHEAKLIRQIVEKLSLELRAINVRTDKNLVGMDTQVSDILSSLGSAYNDVHMIGIWGIGGGGKTTLARAIFNNISFQFERKSFIENVREVSKASLSGLNSLRSQIPLSGGKVLLVLDDVDHLNQLQALAGDTSWFKPGSIIIITTRDKHVLVAHGVKLIHNVSLLSKGEAICLFSKYAFRREIPVQGYKELSRQVVCYAAGLPLTLKVLGSSLCGKSKPEWVDALARLKEIPEEEIQEKLELSYIGLDNEQKEMFLDVATILKGWRKDAAIKALESCGFYAVIGLRNLQRKSLITIADDRVGMHDQLEEMGKNIVRRDMPNKRSRLWDSMEIEDILATDQGTEATRCIKVKYKGKNPEIIRQGLRKMTELRFLHVTMESNHMNQETNKLITNFLKALAVPCCNWKFNKASSYFLDTLRYLHWSNYPHRSLPKGFRAKNLVGIKMKSNDMVQLWEGRERKVLKKLRFLELHGEKLQFIDIGLTPNLEELHLSHCNDLQKLHMGHGCVKLRDIHLKFTKVRTFDLGPSPNLERLRLYDCKDLEEIHIAECPILTNIIFDNLSKLRTLDLRLAPYLSSLSLEKCKVLKELHLADNCQELESLTISRSMLRTLGLGLTQSLKSLDIRNCYSLEELHMASECQKLRSLKISYSNVRTLDIGLTPNIREFDLKECNNLVEIHAPIGCVRSVNK